MTKKVYNQPQVLATPLTPVTVLCFSGDPVEDSFTIGGGMNPDGAM